MSFRSASPKGPLTLDRRGLDAEEAEGDERREADGGPAPRAREDERHTEAEDEDEEGAQVETYTWKGSGVPMMRSRRVRRAATARIESRILAKHDRHDGAIGGARGGERGVEPLLRDQGQRVRPVRRFEQQTQGRLVDALRASRAAPTFGRAPPPPVKWTWNATGYATAISQSASRVLGSALKCAIAPMLTSRDFAIISPQARAPRSGGAWPG